VEEGPGNSNADLNGMLDLRPHSKAKTPSPAIRSDVLSSHLVFVLAAMTFPLTSSWRLIVRRGSRSCIRIMRRRWPVAVLRRSITTHHADVS
jgi:hypothetical protein